MTTSRFLKMAILGCLSFLLLFRCIGQQLLNLGDSMTFVAHEAPPIKQNFPLPARSVHITHKWMHKLPGTFDPIGESATPVLYNGLILLNNVPEQCFDVATGERILLSSDDAKQRLGEAVVEMTTGDSTVFWDVAQGKEIRKVPRASYGEVKVHQTQTIVYADDLGVHCFDRSGNTQWHFGTPGANYEIKLAVDEIIVIEEVQHSGRQWTRSILILDFRGREIARIKNVASRLLSVTLEESLYIALENQVFSLDIRNWSIRWMLEGTLGQYFMLSKGKLISKSLELNKWTGQVLTVRDLGMFSRPAEWNEYLLIMMHDGDEYNSFAIDKETGYISSVNYSFHSRNMEWTNSTKHILFPTTCQAPYNAAVFQSGDNSYLIGLSFENN